MSRARTTCSDQVGTQTSCDPSGCGDAWGYYSTYAGPVKITNVNGKCVWFYGAMIRYTTFYWYNSPGWGTAANYPPGLGALKGQTAPSPPANCSGNGMMRTPRLPRWLVLAVITLISVVRLVISALTPGMTFDVDTFSRWGQVLVDHPLRDFYTFAGAVADHLPGDLCVHALLAVSRPWWGQALAVPPMCSASRSPRRSLTWHAHWWSTASADRSRGRTRGSPHRWGCWPSSVHPARSSSPQTGASGTPSACSSSLWGLRPCSLEEAGSPA